MSTFMGKWDGTETIDLGDGFKVEVKRCLSGRDRQAAMDATYGFRLEGDRTVITKYDVLAQTREMAIASIVSWNLTDVDGSVMPFEHDADRERLSGEPSPLRQSYDRLPGFVQDEIEKVVMRANSPATAQEARRFPAGGGVGRKERASKGRDDRQGAD